MSGKMKLLIGIVLLITFSPQGRKERGVSQGRDKIDDNPA
jgi:hypothetical protein